MRGEFRPGGVKIAREAPSREDAIELRNRLRGGEQRPANIPQALRQLAKDAQDLRGLIFRELHQLVVALDSFQRLEKNGLSRPAGAVHDSRNTATIFRAHWDHEAVVAQGDVVFPGLGIARAENLLERFLDRFASLRDAGANSSQ